MSAFQPEALSPARRRRAGLVVMLLAFGLIGPTVATANGQATPPAQTPPDLTTLDLEQLMQLEVVFAAAKRNQNPREAASVVSVVTAADIRQYGYRTLADILRSLSSFYVSYDRNYSYIGVRGFAQPGDYNSRVLLLVNGLRTNDNVYDMAYVGQEFIVDVDLIDRVEVVRGPSAAIYGTSAFFAVINVVTKSAAAMAGPEVATSAGSFETFAGRASYGSTFRNGISVVASATVSDDAGRSQLYFPEFDDPSTNNGVVDGSDAERFHKLFGSITSGRWSVEASHVARDKRVPTAPFETRFNDGRTRTTDKLTLGSIRYDRSGASGSFGARAHAGRSAYQGRYAYDPANPPNQDVATGEWWGVDLDATRSLSARHLVTAGVEYRNNYRQDQQNFDPEPRTVYVDGQYDSQRLGVFAQDEFKIARTLTLYTGLRHDWYETLDAVTSPRVGLIYNPAELTTLKVLYGRAFRAPNEYEQHYAGLGFKMNSNVGPERIETMELAAERMIGGGIRISAAGFRNRISDLISLQRDAADDMLQFENVGEIDSDGIELGVDINRGRGASGHLGYAFQKTSDHATGEELTNSPRHMAKLRLATPLIAKKLSAGTDVQYVSVRKTLAGAEAKGFVVTNLSVTTPAMFEHVEASASVYNLFATKYGYPASEEHAQDVIVQDGRTFRVKATLRF